MPDCLINLSNRDESRL